MSKIDTSVAKLVAMIEAGELRLPEMQRRYVWPGTRVRDLLDSLYRGYPSGTILVWETDKEMPSRDLAVSQETSPFKGHKLLLDGQQRLTSLSAVLRGEPVLVRGRKRPIDILFNLDHPDGPPVEVVEVEDDTEDDDDDTLESEDEAEDLNIQERLRLRTFVVASKALSADPRWVKVSEIFREDRTDAMLLKRLVKSFDDPLFDRYAKRLQQVRKIRDYPYVMHVLDKALSYEEVAEIFVRVNSLGVKLRGSDLALAQVTSRWKDSLKLFESFQEECEAQWFTLDLGLVVRALVVFATGQSRFKTVGSIPVADLKRAWESSKDGLRYSVNFLRANAGIEDETLLSSPLFLIALAFYASRLKYMMRPADEAMLKRWLYVANARGHYTRGSSETILDADLAVMRRGGGPTELLEVLKQHVGRLEVVPDDLAGRGQRSALFPMAYLAVKARGAKDWRTRLGLSLTHQGRIHFIEHHHIFPKSQLRDAGCERAQINEIANMAFVTGGTNRRIAAKPAEVYLAEVMSTQGREALESHGIPTDPNLWKLDAFPKFLEYRRAELARAMNTFIFDDAHDSAINVADLVARGESDRLECKASARWDYREGKQNKALEAAIAKSVAGLLNARGGRLLIGVDDDGTVCGLEDDYQTFSKRPDRDGYQQFLVNLFSTAMGKDVCASLAIAFCPLDGKEVCVVEVNESPAPVYFRDGQQTRFYVRTGNTTQELDVREANQYIASRWKR
jgi:hypothetical protein